MVDTLFYKKVVVLSDKSQRILRLFDEALKTQSIQSSKYFTPGIENALLARKYELPYVFFDGGYLPKFEPVYSNYLCRINDALELVKGRAVYKKIYAYELKSRFVIVREILLRLVALICSRDGESEKWLAVYIAFAQKINQTDLLVNRNRFFRRGSALPFNLVLGDQKLIDELAQTARDFDMRYKDITNLSQDERKQVEEYRDRVSFKALSDLCRLAKDPEVTSVMPGLLNLHFFEWLAAPDDRQCPIMTSGVRF